jgi:uncharacterized UPF0146 family protein
LKTAEAKDQPEPGVHVLFLEAEEVDRAKEDILEPRAEVIKATGNIYCIRFYEKIFERFPCRNNPFD